jgi:hypothetical protein
LEYVVDRIAWLFRHRDLAGRPKFAEGPPVLRCFFGKLQPASPWAENLMKAFIKDFGDSCQDFLGQKGCGDFQRTLWKNLWMTSTRLLDEID